MGRPLVVDVRPEKHGPHVPSLEVTELNAALYHVVISGALAVLKIDCIVDVSEGIQFVASDSPF